MGKSLLSVVVTTLLLVCCCELQAQQKYEQEKRLKEKEVPATAREFVASLAVPGKVKWYTEYGLNRSSVEAKFKLNEQKHSVEFTPSGQLEDAEVEVDWNTLPAALHDSIAASLCTDCKRYKIRKVQRQFSGDAKAVSNKLKNQQATSCVVRYEVVVQCDSKSGVALYEYLLSDTGQKLERSQIIFKNSSNLEY